MKKIFALNACLQQGIAIGIDPPQLPGSGVFLLPFRDETKTGDFPRKQQMTTNDLMTINDNRWLSARS
jgi:hypothetical protein